MGETMPLEKSHITLVNNEKKCKQLKKLCRPLVKYINEECDPYTEIRVTCDGAFLTSTILGVPNINEEKG
jgi:hypothetical protein